MARPGETEVFRLTPEIGKCYEHAEATRREYIGGGQSRYYTTNEPKYVGEFMKTLRYGYGDGGTVISHFLDSKTVTENKVDYSYAGDTCFREVPCPSRMERRGHAVAAWFRARGIPEKDLKTSMMRHAGNLITNNTVGGKRNTYRKRVHRRKHTRRNN